MQERVGCVFAAFCNTGRSPPNANHNFTVSLEEKEDGQRMFFHMPLLQVVYSLSHPVTAVVLGAIVM